MGQKAPGGTEPIKVTPRTQTSVIERPDFKQLLEAFGTNMAHLRHELNEYNNFVLALPDKELRPQEFKSVTEVFLKLGLYPFVWCLN